MKILNYLILYFFFIFNFQFCHLSKEIKSPKIPSEICFALSESRLNKLPPRNSKKLNKENIKLLSNFFSDRAISVSDDIFVSEYIHEYIISGKKSKKKQKRLFLMKEIHEQISLAHLELSGMLARVDCERDRAMQLASHLDNLSNDEINKLTFYSLIFTIAGTFSAAIIELSGGNNVLYLGADMIFASLAGYNIILSLNLSSKGYLSHKSNLLKELNDNPERSKLYFESVWNFLVDETFPDEISEREEILRIWEKDNSSSEDIKLFLSEGGYYTSTQLYKLVQRLDTLKTRMAFMNLELRQLQDELSDVENEFL